MYDVETTNEDRALHAIRERLRENLRRRCHLSVLWSVREAIQAQTQFQYGRRALLALDP